MSEHTKEPWDYDSNLSIIYGRGKRYASLSEVPEGYAPNEWNEICYLKRKFDYIKRDWDLDNSHENARRIVACVNACEGVPTEALEKATECAKHGVIPTLAAQYKEERDKLRYALAELVDAKNREVFTIEVEANTEDELMNAWTEMNSYWCAAETALIESRTP